MAIAGQKGETLAADHHRVPTTDFHHAEGAVCLDLTDHKANFIHMACDHDARSISHFWVAYPKNASQAVCDHFIHMWSDLFA